MDLFTLSAVLGLDTSGFTAGLSGAEKLLGGFSSFAGGLSEKALKIYGSAYAALGKGALQFAKDTFSAGQKFDESMAGVFAVTETTDQGVQRMLENAAIAEAQISAFTTAEVAMAEYYEGLAGYDADEVVAGLRGIVVAAEASGESLPLVADILTDVARAFGDGAAEQEHYADVLAATATSTNTTIGKMGQSLKYIAPLAGALGYEIEDVAISLGIMADQGTKSSQAGTTLRNIFTRLATNAGQTTKDLGALDILVDKLGVDFYDSEGKVRPWIDVVKDARKAWSGLNEIDRNNVLDAVAEFTVKGKDADEVLKNLKADINSVAGYLNSYQNAKTAAQQEKAARNIRATASSYAELFNLLDMSVDPATDDISSLANALDQARIRLGLMSDEEKIYFSKQIGSMRGMTGWLELMNASEKEFNDVAEAINNADGAAERMRDIRLGSNLFGDITQFKSAVDALQTALYNDIKGPMREITQEATESVRNITQAVLDYGLEGGINQVSLELDRFAEKVGPILESIGKAAAPIVTTLLDTIWPQLDEKVFELGKTLIRGFVKEFDDTSRGSSSPLIKAAGSLLRGWLVDEWDPKEDIQQQLFEEEYQLSLKGVVTDVEMPETVNYGGVEIPVDVIANVDPEQLARNIEISLNHGGNDIEIGDGFIVSNSAAQRLREDIVNGVFGPAGTTGGALMAQNVNNELNKGSGRFTNTVSKSISDAGTSAGNTLASRIQSALSKNNFFVNIATNVSNWFNKPKKYASAMYAGRIFRGSTVFGMSNGSPLVAGDAGPEALIGTTALTNMISSAVANGLSFVQGVGNEVVVPRNSAPREMTVVLQLNDYELGRALVPLVEAEQQRVGVKLVRGGVY